MASSSWLPARPAANALCASMIAWSYAEICGLPVDAPADFASAGFLSLSAAEATSGNVATAPTTRSFAMCLRIDRDDTAMRGRAHPHVAPHVAKGGLALVYRPAMGSGGSFAGSARRM